MLELRASVHQKRAAESTLRPPLHREQRGAKEEAREPQQTREQTSV